VVGYIRLGADRGVVERGGGSIAVVGRIYSWFTEEGINVSNRNVYWGVDRIWGNIL